MYIIRATRQWGCIHQYLIRGATSHILGDDKEWCFLKDMPAGIEPNYSKELADQLVVQWNIEDEPTWVYKVTTVLVL
jgi:hypothetical protein